MSALQSHLSHRYHSIGTAPTEGRYSKMEPSDFIQELQKTCFNVSRETFVDSKAIFTELSRRVDQLPLEAQAKTIQTSEALKAHVFIQSVLFNNQDFDLPSFSRMRGYEGEALARLLFAKRPSFKNEFGSLLRSNEDKIPDLIFDELSEILKDPHLTLALKNQNAEMIRKLCDTLYFNLPDFGQAPSENSSESTLKIWKSLTSLWKGSTNQTPIAGSSGSRETSLDTAFDLPMKKPLLILALGFTAILVIGLLLNPYVATALVGIFLLLFVLSFITEEQITKAFNQTQEEVDFALKGHSGTKNAFYASFLDTVSKDSCSEDHDTQIHPVGEEASFSSLKKRYNHWLETFPKRLSENSIGSKAIEFLVKCHPFLEDLTKETGWAEGLIPEGKEPSTGQENFILELCKSPIFFELVEANVIKLPDLQTLFSLEKVASEYIDTPHEFALSALPTFTLLLIKIWLKAHGLIKK